MPESKEPQNDCKQHVRTTALASLIFLAIASALLVYRGVTTTGFDLLVLGAVMLILTGLVWSTRNRSIDTE